VKKRNLAFIDLETTGLDAEKHEIIEIGCIIVRQIPCEGRGCDLEIIEEIDLKVKPEHLETSDPESLKINSYNDADWLFAISLEQAMKILAEKTDGAVLVAQNIAFDWLFLEKAFVKTKIKNTMDFRRLDLISMAYAKLYHNPKITRFSLHSLCHHFDIKNERAHSAMADIRAEFEVYKRLIQI
jgi:DNA polymerase-3 subunit epsilon